MASGICHTDTYTLDGFDSEGLLGHEGAGIVREVVNKTIGVSTGELILYQSDFFQS